VQICPSALESRLPKVSVDGFQLNTVKVGKVFPVQAVEALGVVRG
jgi:hypothetical protein